MHIDEYIEHLEKNGKVCFTIKNAIETMGKNKQAIYSSIQILVKVGKLARLVKGFYIIIPPAYRKVGCIPANRFINALMNFWNLKYYVGLLSAAAYHGASHQKVMVFQVITEKYKPDINCGNVKVRFIKKQNLSQTEVQKYMTIDSIFICSTPESTAMDLLIYWQQSAGFSHILTVLSELNENMKPDKLLQVLQSNKEIAWKQRLGYILDLINTKHCTVLSRVIHKYLESIERIDYIPLHPKMPINKIYIRNNKWKIIENDILEGDL